MTQPVTWLMMIINKCTKYLLKMGVLIRRSGNVLAWSIFRPNGKLSGILKMVKAIYKKIEYHLKYGPYRLEFLSRIIPLIPGYLAARLSQAVRVLPLNKKNVLF